MSTNQKENPTKNNEESSDDEEVAFVPHKDRPEWSDVTPVPQDEGPNPICRIAYDPQFIDTMDYFRAMLKADERSERSLKLTEEAIELNPGNYTAWYFRRLVLESLNSDLSKEMQFITKLGSKNPKNYQIWYHRKAILEKYKDFSEERNYTAKHIKSDSKNYHSWAHRQWVIQTNEWWEEEKEYIDELLKEDVRNNSAWNQRFFVVLKNKSVNLSEEERLKEVEYALQYARKSPNNQSPWLYIRGIAESILPKLKQTMEEFYEKYSVCPHVASILAEIYEKEGKKEESIKIYDLLGSSLDSMHKKYWDYRASQLVSLG